ncbi:putative methyltransferase-like protein [Dinothrombium tinctorium]|uniref:Putative methyltransferase-like protein n=1 Tax=Dinothrombium tinctorium TaxID=1965070 RepID=A0A3S3PDT0_9ACAR|nr:putative methyltransferase-like protein [Dinothrombium tinctorium]
MSFRLFETFQHSVNYAKYRVSPPKNAIALILNYLSPDEEHNAQRWPAAADVGTGTGQCAQLLAPYFEKVYGFDISEAQLNEAVKSNVFANVEYKAAPAEDLPLADSSVNLVIASQSAHWFELQKFFDEANRILVPGGVIALLGYHMPNVFPVNEHNSNKFKSLINDVYKSSLLSFYWNQNERAKIDSGYKDIILPFADFTRHENIELVKTMRAYEIAGYITSWSGFNKLSENKPDDAKKLLTDFEAKIIALTGKKDLNEVQFDLIYSFFILIGRKR